VNGAVTRTPTAAMMMGGARAWTSLQRVSKRSSWIRASSSSESASSPRAGPRPSSEAMTRATPRSMGTPPRTSCPIESGGRCEAQHREPEGSGAEDRGDSERKECQFRSDLGPRRVPPCEIEEGGRTASPQDPEGIGDGPVHAEPEPDGEEEERICHQLEEPAPAPAAERAPPPAGLASGRCRARPARPDPRPSRCDAARMRPSCGTSVR